MQRIVISFSYLFAALVAQIYRQRAALMEYIMCTAMRKTSTAASNCVGCGKCEAHCPQHIEIRKELQNARKELEGQIYKIARKFIVAFKAY